MSADPRVGTNPFEGVPLQSADPRVGTNPFVGVDAMSADPRVGTNPFQGVVLTSGDPRVGTNPFLGVQKAIKKSGFAARLTEKARIAAATVASKATWFESNPFLEVSEANSTA